MAQVTPNQTYQLVNNQQVPDEGPKAVPLLLDFSGAVTEYDLDLTNFQQRGFISMVQTLYIDMSATGAAELTVTVGNSLQIIKAKPATQGYYPILAPNWVSFKFNSTAASAIVQVFLINVPIAGVVWAV